MKNVYIIVLNWNRKKETLDCLKSLEKLNAKSINLTVMVVDNASKDGSVNAFKNYNPSNFNFKIMENKHNEGFARGNNLAIKEALKSKAGYIMILNNDTIVDKNLVIEMLEPFKDKKVGSTSPMIYFAKGFEFHKDKYKKQDLGKVIWSAGGDIDWDNVFGRNIGVDEVDKGQYKKKREINFATGACVMYRAEALKKIGLFEEKYFMYFEDVELSVRLKRKNYRSKYAPKAKVWHKVAQSSGIGSGLNDYYITRNRLLFGMKYARLRTKIALLSEAARLLLFGRNWQRIGVYDYFIGNLWKGSWR